VMVKVIPIILLFLLIAPIACCPPAANQPPTAYIDSIVPSEATQGEEITFTGHGTDADGNVVAWRWTSSIDGEIGTSASFTISTLSPGNHTISFKVQDNSGAWSAEVTAQVTIEAEMGMDDAVDVVVEEVLPTIPEIQAGHPFWCLKLDSPLPPGTVIEEDSGSTLRLTLNEEVFFFYLDLAPGSYYAHPVKYILVDKDGNHEEYDAHWWPRIDGAVPEGLIKVPPDEDDVADTNVELVMATGTVLEYETPPLYTQLSEGFIVVQGLMPDEALYDDATNTYLNGVNFFNAYKNAFSRVEGLVQSQAAQVLDTIDDMADEGRTVITIYIIAHGNVDGVRLGGQWFTANQFRDKMAEYPDIIFNFILGSCHSGSFIDNLSALDNVCAVETACGPDEGAKPDIDEWGGETDINPLDVGSEWTSSLIQAMLEIVQDPDKMTVVRSSASSHGVPVTSMLICQAGWGALGTQPGLGLDDDFDLSHVLGWTSPRHYCSFETLY